MVTFRPRVPISDDFSRTTYELVENLLMVRAEIDGEAGYFILDTGAPGLILNRRPDRRAAEQMQTISADCAAQSTRVGFFSWGGIERRDMEALLMDMTHLEALYGRELAGVIGFQVFADREILIDTRDRQIYVSRPHGSPFTRILGPAGQLPFTLVEHMPVIELLVGGHRYAFGLDSGCSANLLDSTVLSGRPELAWSELYRQNVQSFSSVPQETSLIELGPVQVGDLPATDMRFLLSDFSHLHEAGLPIRRLLGYTFFRGKVFSINFTTQVISFWEVGPEVSALPPGSTP